MRVVLRDVVTSHCSRKGIVRLSHLHRAAGDVGRRPTLRVGALGREGAFRDLASNGIERQLHASAAAETAISPKERGGIC